MSEINTAIVSAPGPGATVPVRRRAIVMVAGAAAAAAAGAGALQLFESAGSPAAPGLTRSATTATAGPLPRRQDLIARLTVDDGAQIVVSGQVAANRNAAIPLSGLPLEQVRGFLIPGAQNGALPATALTCMTQAVYYEAGFEPATGKRAVAQVVLNRMRHPAYPKSVCGVVYQGSERRTGCQFSFTCDGSLLRSPAAAAWGAAQEVAEAALAGHVEASVGTATHYHADYVLPKWAFQLAKIQQIGAHIFYRFHGGWGRSGAFNGAYSGREWIPSLNYNALRQRQVQAGDAQGQGPIVESVTAPARVVDRKYPKDAGGRVNVTKLWRMEMGRPGAADRSDALGPPDLEDLKPLPQSNSAASALPEG